MQVVANDTRDPGDAPDPQHTQRTTKQPFNDQKRSYSKLSEADHRPGAIECPWCESLDTERVGVIGSHLMVSQYICLDCHSPFEVIRR